ncbi:MAG: hypothetical protein WA213_19405 [Terriglobales bacterium]
MPNLLVTRAVETLKQAMRHIRLDKGVRFEQDGQEDRRKEPRRQASGRALVKILDSRTPTAPAIQARVLSASTAGLQLQVGFIFPRRPVQIQLPDRVVSGQVRYCVASGDDFCIGIRLH